MIKIERINDKLTDYRSDFIEGIRGDNEPVGLWNTAKKKKVAFFLL